MNCFFSFGHCQTRVQELETALEAKDNEILRSLKASHKTSCRGVIQNGVNCNPNSNSLPGDNFESYDQRKNHSELILDPDQMGSLTSNPLFSRKLENVSFTDDMDVKYTKKGTSTSVDNNKTDDYFVMDEDEDSSKFSMVPLGLSNPTSKHQRSEKAHDPKSSQLRSEVLCGVDRQTTLHRLDSLEEHLGSGTGINSDQGKTPAALEEGVTLLLDEVTQVEPMLNIRKESPSLLSLSKPGIFFLLTIGVCIEPDIMRKLKSS